MRAPSKLFVGLLLCAPLALSADDRAVGAKHWTLYQSPVRVEAILTASNPTSVGYSFEVQLLDSQGEPMSVHTFIVAKNVTAALATLRGDVVWNAPYFLITTSCDCNRSSLRAVFTVDHGTVVALGELLAGGPASMSYHDSQFYDSWGNDRPPDYDWGLCMACGPAVEVVMVENHGQCAGRPARSRWCKSTTMKG